MPKGCKGSAMSLSVAIQPTGCKEEAGIASRGADGWQSALERSSSVRPPPRTSRRSQACSMSVMTWDDNSAVAPSARTASTRTWRNSRSASGSRLASGSSSSRTGSRAPSASASPGCRDQHPSLARKTVEAYLGPQRDLRSILDSVHEMLLGLMVATLLIALPSVMVGPGRRRIWHHPGTGSHPMPPEPEVLVAILETHDIGKRYGRRRAWALRHLDLSVPPGSVTALVGMNGSGKSTVLKAWIRDRQAGASTWPECAAADSSAA